MASLALISVATVALLFLVNANAQSQEPPIRNVIDALEMYYRSRFTGQGERESTTGRSGGTRVDTGRGGGTRVDTGRPQEWDWEWDQTTAEREVDGEVTGREREVEETVRNPLERLSTMVEDLQIRLFLDDVRSTSRSYQDLCPKLMDLLGRGFMRQWLAGYLQRPTGEGERHETRTDRHDVRTDRTEWSNELSRLLRRRTTTEGRDGDRTERGSERGSERGTERGSERGTERGSERGTERGSGSERITTADANSPMWQGLMASCYIYQDVVHGNAPRLDAATRGRTAQQ